MYTQQEASAIRQKFWIKFGKYMAPIPSSNDEKVQWINYRTGIKGINFKMDADADQAYIGIEISHSRQEERDLYFSHFKTFKKGLEDMLEETWIWEDDHVKPEGTHVARIYTAVTDVNIFKESDWPEIISFLKVRMIALDKFWNEYREIFEMLH